MRSSYLRVVIPDAMMTAPESYRSHRAVATHLADAPAKRAVAMTELLPQEDVLITEFDSDLGGIFAENPSSALQTDTGHSSNASMS